MDPSLKYSEIIKSSEESNPVVDLLNKPSKKPRMVFKKSKVLARVMELLPRLQDETIPKSSDLNIENCSEDEPYIELSAIGFTKEPENESDPKMVILHESGNEELSSEDEGGESGEDESRAGKALIEDISEQTLTVRKENEKDLLSIENEKVSTLDRTVDGVSPVKKKMKMISKNNICEEMVH